MLYGPVGGGTYGFGSELQDQDPRVPMVQLKSVFH